MGRSVKDGKIQDVAESLLHGTDRRGYTKHIDRSKRLDDKGKTKTRSTKRKKRKVGKFLVSIEAQWILGTDHLSLLFGHQAATCTLEHLTNEAFAVFFFPTLTTLTHVKPRATSAESLANFNEECRSPFFTKEVKKIYHPGEVNRLRVCNKYPHLLVTHTDAVHTYLWDVEKQKNRNKDKNFTASTADLILEGHEDLAEYALASSSPETACFASGGKDKYVLLWDLEDFASNGGNTGGVKSRNSLNSGGMAQYEISHLKPRIKFRGHTDTVEDVAFHPKSSDEVVSVADDKSVRFWDFRAGEASVSAIANAHESDVQCVDWSVCNSDYILTGAADGSVKVFDRRKLGGSSVSSYREVKSLHHHRAAILQVEWNPHKEGVFGTAGEDGLLHIWDMNKNTQSAGGISSSGNHPSELLFKHVGHRGEIKDFQWNMDDPWTILSVSTDLDMYGKGSGGSIQIHRMNDLVYRPREEVLKELEENRNKLISAEQNQVS